MGFSLSFREGTSCAPTGIEGIGNRDRDRIRVEIRKNSWSAATAPDLWPGLLAGFLVVLREGVGRKAGVPLRGRWRSPPLPGSAMLPDEASACLDQVPLSILVRLSFPGHAREQLLDPGKGTWGIPTVGAFLDLPGQLLPQELRVACSRSTLARAAKPPSSSSWTRLARRFQR